MIAKEELDYDILIEASKDSVDDYYALLKRKGWFDFVVNVQPEHKEEGVRLNWSLTAHDYKLRYAVRIP